MSDATHADLIIALREIAAEQQDMGLQAGKPAATMYAAANELSRIDSERAAEQAQPSVIWSRDLADHLWRYAQMLEIQAAQAKLAHSFYPESYPDGSEIADEALAVNDLANCLHNLKCHLVRRKP